MTSSKLGRGAAAATLALPLALAPIAAPAAAAASSLHLVDWSGPYGMAGYGWSYGSYGQAYGGYAGGGAYGGGYGGSYGDGQGYAGGQSGPGSMPGSAGGTSTTQDATTASAAASSGLVMINTDVDYDEGEAAGTGIVLQSDGIVVTNHHVVQGATTITVTTPAGNTYPATVVGYDAKHDVAVLRLTGATGLATATTDRTRVTTGEKVDAVGNAEGQGVLTDAAGSVLTPSTAIDVTEDDGSTKHLSNLIETSADVVPGDSGGGLRNSAGQVVGMDVAASSGTTDTTGYAIPIGRVLRIAQRILAGNASGPVVLGTSAAIGISLEANSLQVAEVDAPAAEQAGLAAGDTITSVGGTSVTTYAQLKAAVAQHQPGDRVEVAWRDGSGAAHSAEITLGTAPIA